MRLATACSGIGAPEEAARALGWTPTWCAESLPHAIPAAPTGTQEGAP